MVEAKRENQLAAQLQARNHSFISGVAEKLGGANEGADPHELLEGALAACTVITVQMYANRKSWKLISTHVKVRVESEGKQTKISREISFEGDLDEEQKTRLMEIANKCPIHNLLESQITIETKAKA